MAEDRPPPRRRWPWPLRAVLWLVAGLAALVAVAFVGIDSDAGHRLLVDKIEHLRPSSGLRIHIGRIDGSLWHRARIRDLQLSDSRGVFLESPQLDLAWRPLDWLANRLTVERLAGDIVVLHRLPKLKPSGEQGPLLPSFDIRLDALSIVHLRLGAEAAGVQRTGGVEASADVSRGRARVALTLVAGRADRAVLRLVAEPDQDRFDLAARISSPANGMVGGLVGTHRPLALVVSGAGDWRAWAGTARLDVSGLRTADLHLDARAGRYRLKGFAAPAPLLSGKLQRLTSPRIAISGEGTLADRTLTGRFAARSPALLVAAHGTIDLATSRFAPLFVDARLDQPAALFPNMTGRDVRLHAELDGAFATARFRYAATAPHLQFDDTGFDLAKATGEGHLSRAPIAMPIRFTAARITGIGDVAGGILARLDVAGVLQVTPTLLTGDGLTLKSDKLLGKLQLRVDLVTGTYDVAVTGALTRYLIPGLGIVDVSTKVSVVPGPGGHGTMVAGRGQAWVRRFDNAFLRGLAGGLPQIDTGLTRTPDGIVHFAGLRLTAPAISITGDGYRRKDGSFHFEGSGRQATYGAFTLLLDGQIDHPHVELKLAAPVPALGLAAVSAVLEPTPRGFDFHANGGSTLGAFIAIGAILLPPNQPAVVAVADLAVAGTHARGDLRSDPDGFTGTLALNGGGLGGALAFAPAGTIQRIEAHLTAIGATLPLGAPTQVRRGKLDGVILLDPAGVSIEGRTQATGLRRGGLFLARVGGTASLRGGQGKVTVDAAGSRGRAFDLHGAATIDNQAIRVTGTGTVDRQPIALAEPAVLVAEGGGWRLASSTLSYGGGSAKLSGRFGTDADTIQASLDRMPLGVLDLFYPGLGLGGAASGQLSYAGGASPSGRANLSVRGLTRAGLVLASQPVDLGLTGLLDGRGAAARAVVASGGKVIGRAQGRISPLGTGDGLVARLMSAPLFAQVRYAGPADTIWRLTAVEGIDLTGPIAIGADVGGTIARPVIRGSVSTSGARLESAVTGTVIQSLVASGRFNGSELSFDRFTGATPGGGTLSGRASFDFGTAAGFGFSIDLTADNALLLNAEDIGAAVTGPVSIRSSGGGGMISGDVKLMKSRYRLGQAAAAAVPRIAVREVNLPDDSAEEVVARPWTLALKARASNRIAVSGLGLDSEWRANLTIAGTVDAPRITGEADLVRGGYQFAGRRFDLERGIIRFNGESPPDPALDITATADITGLSAAIRVTGTGQKPEISFTSVPALPEDELLSRLLFGTSITNLSAPEALQLAAAVASLRTGSGGLDPINAVRKAAGLDRLRILPADATTGQRTTIAAGKYVTRRIYIEVATDGQGYSATRVEWELTRWLSLLSSISTLGRTSANVRISKDY